MIARMSVGMSCRKLLCAIAVSGIALSAAQLVHAQVRARSAGIFESEPFTAADGGEIFTHICQGCHQPDARGAVGAGHYPALARNSSLASARYLALTVLVGRRNMPAFGARHAIGFVGPAVILSDAQIAAVTNYVRSHFGNRYQDKITAAEVAALEPALHEK